MAITPIPTEGSPIFTADVRDITDRRRRDQRRVARLAITQTLAEATSFAEAAPRILQAAGESLEWKWRPVAGGSRRRGAPLRRSLASTGGASGGVRGDDAKLHLRPRQGSARPRVDHAKPAWIPDVTRDANFPRAAVANKERLHGAFACPIVLDREVLGVIEFFSHQIREPDADLLEMMATIGSQIGHFIERKRADRALRMK